MPIIVLGLAAVLIVNSRKGASVTIVPAQVTESSDFLHGVSPVLLANSKIAHGDSTAYLYGIPPAPPFHEVDVTLGWRGFANRVLTHKGKYFSAFSKQDTRSRPAPAWGTNEGN